MAYRFRLKEPFSEGFYRIAAKQVERARDQTLAPNDADAGVHNARKALKRLRALLKLVRPGIGEEAYSCENDRLRTISRMYSGRRDFAVMQQTLTTLEALNGAASIQSAVSKARVAILAIEDPAKFTFPPHGALEALDAAKMSLADLSFRTAHVSALAKGLRRSYRDCRKAYGSAFADAEGESFHSWRKTVQVHWRHMTLLEPAWPEFMSARAQAARQLAQVLGLDHDLYVLAEFVTVETADIDRKSAFDLAKLCRKRQKALRQTAQVLGARLTAEKASGLSRRVALYWSSAATEKRLDIRMERNERPSVGSKIGRSSPPK